MNDIEYRKAEKQVERFNQLRWVAISLVIFVLTFALGIGVSRALRSESATSTPTFSHPACYRFSRVMQELDLYTAPGATISDQRAIQLRANEWATKTYQAAKGTNIELDVQQFALAVLTMDRSGSLERASVIQHHCDAGTVK